MGGQTRQLGRLQPAQPRQPPGHGDQVLLLVHGRVLLLPRQPRQLAQLVAHLGQGQAGGEASVETRCEAGEGLGPGQQVGLLVIHHSISLCRQINVECWWSCRETAVLLGWCGHAASRGRTGTQHSHRVTPTSDTTSWVAQLGTAVTPTAVTVTHAVHQLSPAAATVPHNSRVGRLGRSTSGTVVQGAGSALSQAGRPPRLPAEDGGRLGR